MSVRGTSQILAPDRAADCSPGQVLVYFRGLEVWSGKGDEGDKVFLLWLLLLLAVFRVCFLLESKPEKKEKWQVGLFFFFFPLLSWVFSCSLGMNDKIQIRWWSLCEFCCDSLLDCSPKFPGHLHSRWLSVILFSAPGYPGPHRQSFWTGSFGQTLCWLSFTWPLSDPWKQSSIP